MKDSRMKAIQGMQGVFGELMGANMKAFKSKSKVGEKREAASDELGKELIAGKKSPEGSKEESYEPKSEMELEMSVEGSPEEESAESPDEEKNEVASGGAVVRPLPIGKPKVVSQNDEEVKFSSPFGKKMMKKS